MATLAPQSLSSLVGWLLGNSCGLKQTVSAAACLLQGLWTAIGLSATTHVCITAHVLAGGATALEGQAKGDAPPSPGPSSAGIRLAGATHDVHIMDVRSGKWEKVTPQGEPPSPRAAHAAAAVGNMVVVQGGIGPAGLASEDLHVLDFTDLDKPRWHRCDC